MLKWTKYLVIGSIVLSILSFINLRVLGGKEIYPFFYWKLYSQPNGAKFPVSTYRIYAVSGLDTIRIENKGYETFNKDDYIYFLSREITRIQNGEIDLRTAKQRILSFSKSIAPNYNRFLVIEEVYYPFEIIKDSLAFQKKVVFEIRE